MGPAGVLAVAPCTTSRQVRAIVVAAREFAAEWTELRSIFQSKLFGHVLRPPLQVLLLLLRQSLESRGACHRLAAQPGQHKGLADEPPAAMRSCTCS